MANNVITVSLWLKDRLTAPLKTAKKAIDDLNRGSHKINAAQRTQAQTALRTTRQIVKAHEQRAAAAKKSGDIASWAYSRERKLFKRFASDWGREAAQAENRRLARQRVIYRRELAAWKRHQERMKEAAKKAGKSYRYDQSTKPRSPGRDRRWGYEQSADGKFRHRDTGHVMNRALDRTLRQMATLSMRNETLRIKFANNVTKATARMIRGVEGAENMNRAVYRLSRRYGLGREQAESFGRATERIWRNLPNQAGRAADRVGAAMGRMYAHQAKIRSALGKSWTFGVAAPATAAAGYAAYAGLQRYNTFEQSDVRLDILGFDEKQADDIQSKVDEMVLGTPIALPDAMGIASKLLQSRVEPGAQFEDYMQKVLDVSAVYAPHDVPGVAMVYGQIQQKGHLTGEEAMQLNERLVPIKDALMEKFDLDGAQLDSMMEKKQITAEMVWEASDFAAGGAKKMGNTFQGQVSQLLTALGRAGQVFWEAIAPGAIEVFAILRQGLNDLKPFFTDIGANLGRGLDEAADVLPKVGAALEPLKQPLQELFSALGDALPEIIHGLAIFIRLVTWLAEPLIEFSTGLLHLSEWALPGLIPLLLTFLHILAGFGMLTAIGAMIMGWAVAAQKLYGPLWKLMDMTPKLKAFWKTLSGSRIGAALLKDLPRLAGQIFRWLTRPFIAVAQFLFMWAKALATPLITAVTRPLILLRMAVWASLRALAMTMVTALTKSFALARMVVASALRMLSTAVVRGFSLLRVAAWASLRAMGGTLVATVKGMAVAVARGFSLLRVAAWANLRRLGGGFLNLFKIIARSPAVLRVLGLAFRAIPFIGWAILIWDLIRGFKYLYENVAIVRQAFDFLGNVLRTVFGFFDRIGDKIDEFIDEKLPALRKLLDFGSGKGVGGDDRDWGTRVTDAAAAFGEWAQLPDLDLNPDGPSRAEKAERHRERGVVRIEGGKGPRTADDILAGKGFAAGGYTGNAPVSAVTGYVHGQEYVMDAWATRSVENTSPGALSYIQAHGALPPAGGGLTYAPHIELNVGSGTDAEAFRAIVREEMARQARQLNRQYGTPGLRGAR